MSASAKPRLAGRQPSNRGGVPRVMTRLIAEVAEASAGPGGPPGRRGTPMSCRRTACRAPPRHPRSHPPVPAGRWAASRLVLFDPDSLVPPLRGVPVTNGWSFETRQIHAGQAPDPTTGARALPIYQTTSYVFRDSDHAANLFALKELGNIYTRIMNPTQDAVEQRLASLEGGVGALLVASGQAAEVLAILNLAEVGDHLVSSPSLYGGTYNLFHYTLPKLGIEVSFVEDPDDFDAWRAAARPNTKAFYAQTIGNPRRDILDIEAVAGIAHEWGVPLIVDNTVATPYLIRPFEWGADIVVHSATKYLGGHGTAIAGVIVDSGTFDWAAQGDRFPGLTTPDPSYHGVVYTDALGPAAYIAKARVQLLRDLGPAIAPFNAFLIAQGLETLSLRVERHCANALAVAQWLDQRDEVESVAYAGLPSSQWHELGQKYAPRGTGGVLA